MKIYSDMSNLPPHKTKHENIHVLPERICVEQMSSKVFLFGRFHFHFYYKNSIGLCGILTCWLSQTLPGEGLSLLPLVQLPHGIVPHRPPLLRRGDGGGGGWTESPVVHGARDAGDAVRPHHVAGKRAITLGVAGHNLGPVAGHVPR